MKKIEKKQKKRMKWVGTDYEIVLEKLEMLESLKEADEVNEALVVVDWMLENEELSLVEERRKSLMDER
jgi:hypothetical protein